MNKKLGVSMLTALVVGNMVGSGVFLLPASLASFGGITIFSWIATAMGAMLLALVFAKLSKLFSRRFGRVSKNCSPVFGIVLSSVLVTLVLILNFNKNLVDQFTFIISLATLAGIIAYLYTSVAEFVIYIKYPEKAHKKKIVKTLTISGLAFLYTFWATISAGQGVVFYGSLLLFSSISIYGWMEWQKHRSIILNRVTTDE
ncbi:amino acid permease [Candidatus Neptunichlamydia sp. REUL1]|uniref:amino acid permease n=1 Tax=Candidatus Neptunichlamydia sp. REUL1 TaxID=3064277 RepID=UPI0029300B9F|nr:amino acid permease [Candidatus Neptunochlamydia sp. REUL1]